MRSIARDLESASTMEMVEATVLIAARLADREAPDSGTAALELAETLGRALDLLEAGLARLVGRVDDMGTFAELGFSSTGAWLRSRLGMRDGRAAERVRLARQLPRLTKVAEKLAGGALSLGYAGAIADAVARLDDRDAQVGEDLLLGMVDAGHTAGQIAKDGAEITDLINQHRGKEKEPEESKRGFSRSWMTRSKSLDGGSWVKAWLTPEHSATFEQIIGPIAKPKAKGDDRDLAQRTADALMAVISGGNKSAGVTVIIDLAAYTAATGDTGPFDFARQAQGRQDRTGARERPDGRRAGRDDPFSQKTLDDLDDTDGRVHEDDATELGAPVDSDPAGRPDPDDFWDLGNLFDLDGVLGGRTSRESDHIAEDDNADHRPGGGPDKRCRIRWNGRHHRYEDRSGDRRNHHEPDRPAGRAAGDAPERRDRARERNRDDRGQARARPRAAARLLNGTGISPERARQIALNAGINLLILGRSGQPLYLGRTVRFATPAQRKALLAIYETCCVEGCQIPAHSCEVHHLDGGWKLGTPTDIDKLAFACGWHNRWVETHADQVEQTRDRNGRTVLRILTPWERRAVALTR